jgi:hypothetical protein
MASVPARAVNPARQLTAIRAVLPAVSGVARHGQLDCVLPIQPSPASRVYTVRLRYQPSQRPRLTVTDPALELHSTADQLPHIYPGDELCLYYPGEWDCSMSLATTIVPWIAEWLLYYELWLSTGQWTGGGRHPR